VHLPADRCCCCLLTSCICVREELEAFASGKNSPGLSLVQSAQHLALHRKTEPEAAFVSHDLLAMMSAALAAWRP